MYCIVQIRAEFWRPDTFPFEIRAPGGRPPGLPIHPTTSFPPPPLRINRLRNQLVESSTSSLIPLPALLFPPPASPIPHHPSRIPHPAFRIPHHASHFPIPSSPITHPYFISFFNTFIRSVFSQVNSLSSRPK